MLDFIKALKKNVNKEFTEETKRRAEICAACPEKRKSFYSEFVNAEIKEVKGFVCNRCECPISTKVFAEDKENICEKWLK